MNVSLTTDLDCMFFFNTHLAFDSDFAVLVCDISSCIELYIKHMSACLLFTLCLLSLPVECETEQREGYRVDV